MLPLHGICFFIRLSEIIRHVLNSTWTASQEQWLYCLSFSKLVILWKYFFTLNLVLFKIHVWKFFLAFDRSSDKHISNSSIYWWTAFWTLSILLVLQTPAGRFLLNSWKIFWRDSWIISVTLFFVTLVISMGHLKSVVPLRHCWEK